MATINQPTASIRNFPSTLRFFQDMDKHLDSFPRFSHSIHGNRGPHLGQAFLPIFDVRELSDSFELHGELPGVKKENIKIQFKGNKSLEVSGFVENSYQSPSNQGDKGDAPDDTASKETKSTEVRRLNMTKPSDLERLTLRLRSTTVSNTGLRREI